jgi:hypothetical protein
MAPLAHKVVVVRYTWRVVREALGEGNLGLDASVGRNLHLDIRRGRPVGGCWPLLRLLIVLGGRRRVVPLLDLELLPALSRRRWVVASSSRYRRVVAPFFIWSIVVSIRRP